MVTNFDAELFISEIHKRNAIWDTSSPDHDNPILRRKSWNEVIEIFGSDNMTASDKKILEYTLRKRWRNMRTSFGRELKRQKNYGAGLGRKSEYKHYKQLIFLTNVMNIVEKESDEDSEYVHYDENQIKVNSALSIEHNNVDKLDDDISDREEDEDRLFLLSLHKTMQRIPKHKKLAIKIKMLSVLNEASENDNSS